MNVTMILYVYLTGILESIKDIAFIPAAKVNTMLSKMYPTLAQHTNTPYITFAQGKGLKLNFLSHSKLDISCRFSWALQT